jgi:hypothetical protein
MKNGKHIVFGVHITSRMNHASKVQGLFSEYGCNIKTRIGLHDVNENVCSPNGLILLEMFGDESRCNELKDKLNVVEGVEVKAIEFDHP